MTYLFFLLGLRTEYTLRRDFFIDLLSEEFAIRRLPAGANSAMSAWTGCDVYAARAKRASRDTVDEKAAFGEKTLFTFVPPAAGMFIWVSSLLSSSHFLSIFIDNSLNFIQSLR